MGKWQKHWEWCEGFSAALGNSQSVRLASLAVTSPSCHLSLSFSVPVLSHIPFYIPVSPFFFLVPTLPCLLSRDNYHYLSSLQDSVCSVEMRSVKGRWESIHSEGKVINTHTHTHAYAAAPRRLVTPDLGEPITTLREVNQQQRWECCQWPWKDCNLRGLVNCINNDSIRMYLLPQLKGAHWWSLQKNQKWNSFHIFSHASMQTKGWYVNM